MSGEYNGLTAYLSFSSVVGAEVRLGDRRILE